MRTATPSSCAVHHTCFVSSFVYPVVCFAPTGAAHRLAEVDPLGTMAALGYFAAVAEVFGMRITGFPAWWIRRTYYLFQMPRWDRRLRMILDWTVALLFRPDVTKVDLVPERDPAPRNAAPDI